MELLIKALQALGYKEVPYDVKRTLGNREYTLYKEEKGGETYVKLGHGKFGYSGFAMDFVFNDDNEFIGHGCWE